MYAFNAQPTLDGVLSFNPSATAIDVNYLTFACASHTKTTVTQREWETLGAIGKCLLWPEAKHYSNSLGFGPAVKSTDAAARSGSERRFTTCLRVLRADYCGDGVTYTRDNTYIYLYEGPESALQPPVVDPPPDFTLEAK